jgi:TolA-binding protein
MNKETKDTFDNAEKTPDSSEVFANQAKENVSAQDIFVGDRKFYRTIEKAAFATPVLQAGRAAVKTASSLFSTTHVILIINLLVLTAVLAYVLLRPPIVTVQAGPLQPKTAQPDQTPPKTQNVAVALTPAQLAISKRTAAALEKANSWQLAERLYNIGEYNQACYVFSKLSEKLTTNIPADEFLKDFFQLKMALCLQKTQTDENLSTLFTTALQSRSPVVRTLANYHLTFTELANKQYLNARTRIYRTLALLETLENRLSVTFEADCYFTLADALTRQILLLNNAPDTLPGQFWSDTLTIESVPQMSQDELRSFLQAAAEQLGEGAIAPRIQKRRHLGVGSQWSVICAGPPLEEMLSRFASAANLNVIWPNSDNDIRNKPVTMYLPTASEQLVTEVAAGTTGLIARFDGNNIVIRDPGFYDDLAEYKKMLTREAAAVWRRFLLKYRGDHRTPNAHYALGLVHDYGGETAAALGEYKFVSSGYPNNQLAPFALLNASKLKTNIHDYAGAREDLNEILIQYPDCKVVDQTSLYLAEATMAGGLYDDAVKMFQKVYNLDLNRESKCSAAYGLGKCFYDTQQHTEAVKWLTHAVKLTDNTADHRLRPAYFMLGKTHGAMGDYKNASGAFRNALDNSTRKTEYIEVTLELVRAEAKQQNFVVALNILESIPTSRLSQEYACEVLVAKAEILRSIDLCDTAVSLLRRKIEFIADSRIRAKLTFELAKCYVAIGDLRVARKKLTDALIDLGSGVLAQQANLLLAEVSMKLGENKQAKDVCLQLLARTGGDEIKSGAFDLLGQICTRLEQHDEAALAYAGIFNPTGAVTQ